MANHDSDWDLEDLGDRIQNIIDRAVTSQNYQKLNQTVRQTVNRAIDTGTEAIRRSNEKSYQRNSACPTWEYSRFSSNPKTTVESKRHSTRIPEPELPILYGSTTSKMLGGIFKCIGGGLITFSAGAGLIGSAFLKWLLWGTLAANATTVFLGATLLGGGLLLGNGIQTIGKMNRFEKYVKTLGSKTYCSLQQLSRSVGKPVPFVQKEVGKFIKQGLFLEGHIDTNSKTLITSDETYHHYQQSLLQQEEQKRLAEIARKEEAKRQESHAVDARVQEVLDKGNAFLEEIRRCNELIPGEEISEKISRMEEIVQRIFERAEAHPEIVPDLSKLMDYYLPMTVKLLNAYADMDKQPIQGETIRSSKKEIEDTLDTLNSAFEKLLDSIFKDTAMDVSSDISVLQTLLAQEGLTDDELAKIKKSIE